MNHKIKGSAEVFLHLKITEVNRLRYKIFFGMKEFCMFKNAYLFQKQLLGFAIASLMFTYFSP